MDTIEDLLVASQRNKRKLMIWSHQEYLPSSNLLAFRSTPMILDAPAILAPSAA
jgi:hypothetical protein